jgi:hypothetical protein
MKAVVKTVEPAEREARFDHIRPHYLEALTLVERLHRRLLDVIKDEFDRRGRADINSVQALLLYNIGDKELTAGELRTRGYYLGSNVSYNLKKLVETGFLDHQRSREAAHGGHGAMMALAGRDGQGLEAGQDGANTMIVICG